MSELGASTEANSRNRSRKACAVAAHFKSELAEHGPHRVSDVALLIQHRPACSEQRTADRHGMHFNRGTVLLMI